MRISLIALLLAASAGTPALIAPAEAQNIREPSLDRNAVREEIAMVQRRDRLFTAGEMAQNHQPALMRERLQKVRRAARAGCHPVERLGLHVVVECGQRHKDHLSQTLARQIAPSSADLQHMGSVTVRKDDLSE